MSPSIRGLSLTGWARRSPTEVVMADDKSKRGPQDRAPVDGGEDYEVGYLMKKHHLERADALRLVKKYGNNRAKIEEELAARKR